MAAKKLLPHEELIERTHLKMSIIDFFECPWLLNIGYLSPIQKIMLKSVMAIPLDDKTPIPITHPYQEKAFANEIEMYKYFTGKSEYRPSFYSDVDWLNGRRSGKCVVEGTLVLTPHGPVKIEDIKVGDTVYGYNSDGSVTPTIVTRTYDNGVKEVIDLTNSGKVLASSTEDHRWLTNITKTWGANRRYVISEQAVKDFRSKDVTIARAFVKIPCGVVKEPHAYAIGALLGDGGRRLNHVGGYISSPNSLIPDKVSKILNTPVTKNSSKNYTYYIHQLKKVCNYYNEWMGERLSHEKIVDWSVVDTWDRESLLQFVAGLLDTDGSVFLSSDTRNINLGFGCQSRTTVEAFQKAFFKLWQHKLTIHTSKREGYVNGPMHYVNCKSNLYVKMALKELDQYLVTPSKKWKQEYADFPEQRQHNRIGVKKGKKYQAHTYDIEVNNATHLYVLANEGLITHNSTTLGAGLTIYFATQFDYKPYLRTSPNATIPIISPTKRQAGEVYSAIKTMFLRSPYLYETFLDGNVDSFKEEYSEDGVRDSSIVGGTIRLNNKAVIEVMAADIAKMRGMAVPFAILDENCFFGADTTDNKNTDKGIYEALAPALLQFQSVPGMAMILKISSPNGQSGLMYDNFLKSKDDDVIHFQVPTWYANPSVPVSYLKKQEKKGMTFFNREYGANYTAAETAYLDPTLIDNAVLKGMEKLDYNPKYRYVAAMDYATKDDYWTLAIGHKEYILSEEEGKKRKKEEIIIDYATQWRGTQGNELNPADVIPPIANLMREYRISYLIADQFAFAPLKTLFQKEKVTLKEFKISHQSKLKYMFSLQVNLNSDILRMVANPLAIKHLKDLREKRSATTNRVRIEHCSGGHDDHADSIALVIYQFDKTSPIYVGSSEGEKEVNVVKNKDATGKFIATPTAEDLAQHVGIRNFNDNRAEIEARDAETEEDDEGSGFWFIW